MSVTIVNQALLPTRRDGQGSNFMGAGSSFASAVGGGSGIQYLAGSFININGAVISAVTGTTSTTLAVGNHLHTGVYLPIDGCADDSSRLGGNLPAYYAPVNNPVFTGIAKAPVFSGSTCIVSPVICATNCVSAVNLVLACDAGSAAFTSGFAGSGWKLDNNAGTSYDLEVDNLRVRGTLLAQQLEINKISAVNGSLVISSANACAYGVNGTCTIFDTDGGSNPIPFAVGDIIRAQQFTGSGVASYIGRVTSVTQSPILGSAFINATTISGTPWAKMSVVQVGNCSDAARQNLIYMTASDSCNPYISVLAGVTGGTFAGKERVRIGNLAGITDSTYGALTGYGLYSDNAYLKGKLVATSGEFQSSVADYAGKCSSVKLSGADIYENNYAGDASILWLNRIGYNGTNCYFRNLAIGDGKGNSIAVFAPELINFWTHTHLNCGVDIAGGLLVNGGLQLGNLAARTTETTVLYLSADGHILTGTVSGGGTTYCGGANISIVGSTISVGISPTFTCKTTLNAGALLSAPTLGAACGTLLLGSQNTLYGTAIGISSNGDTWIQSQRFDANTSVYNLILQPSGGRIGIGTLTPTRTVEIRKDVANGVGASLLLTNCQYSGNAGAETEIILAHYSDGSGPYRYGKIHTVGANADGTVDRISLGIATSPAAYSDILSIYATGNAKIAGSLDSVAGYISSGNAGGTGSAAHFPSGMYSMGYNWIYGRTYMNEILRDAVTLGGKVNIDFTNGNATFGGTVTGVEVTATSDLRLKENIKPIEIKPIDIDYKQFNMIDRPEQQRYGVVAQDLQLVAPELVRENDKGLLSVNYIDLFVREIAFLKAELNNLKKAKEN